VRSKALSRFTVWCFFAITLPGLALGQTPLGSAAPPRPSSPPPGKPTFHAESRLVVVDVVVTRHGHPVTDLSKTDFTILEDGKLQNLAIFEPHAFHETSTAPSPPPPLPPNQYSNVSSATPSAINIVLFDILNTPLTDQPYAREQMVQFLKTLPQGEPVALFELTARLRMIAGLGTSSEELIAAAGKIVPHSSERLDTQAERQEAEQEITELRQGSPNQEFFDRMQDFLHETTAARDLDRTKSTLQAFEELARAVSGYAGRKNVLWLSEEFPVYFGPSLNRDEAGRGLYTYSDVEHQAATRLSAAEISLYPIDVRGLAVMLAGASARSAGVQGVQQLDHIHDAMDELARETGGRAFYDTNALKDAMRASIENGSTYYTLAYVPANQNWDSKYHHIKVQLARSGLESVYRKGYFATPETPPSEDQAARSLLTALQPATPQSTMIRLKAQVLPPDPEHAKVRIHYLVDGSGLKFADGTGNRKNGTLQFITIAWDRNLKAAVHSSHTMELSLPPEKYDYVVHNGLAIYDEFELPPGPYNLCLGVMDQGSKKIGTLNVPLQIAEPRKTAPK